jgi:hypothetical protein
MTDAAFDEALRAFAAERKYHGATVDRWLQLQAGDGAALLDLARGLRLGENQLRDLWECAEDIATRDCTSIAQVLANDAIARATRRQVGRNDKLKLVKGALRRLRFPVLVATEDRLRDLVRDLQLPANVRVTLPDCLEGDRVRVEIVATSVASLRDSVARLLEAAQTPACVDIFELLAEAPDVGA